MFYAGPSATDLPVLSSRSTRHSTSSPSRSSSARPSSCFRHRIFAIAFIERSPFLVLSTSNKDGLLDASPKGDGPGFVLVESDRSLVIPDRPGNGLAMGHLNVLENPRVGLLFLIPGTNETLRVNGCAELTRNPALLERLAARGKPAVLAIRVEIEECFFHCGKAFIRSNLWQPEQWGERHRVS
ncbi:MAG: pyridoxamine 5'-phosphate oxidase family protein, partial [Deltaproteobacteria bacterium]|nr:pyridoxamine 5'-phosphate oxidase family protein [Deltaproteobacteria bacterium]